MAIRVPHGIIPLTRFIHKIYVLGGPIAPPWNRQSPQGSNLLHRGSCPEATTTPDNPSPILLRPDPSKPAPHSTPHKARKQDKLPNSLAPPRAIAETLPQEAPRPLSRGQVPSSTSIFSVNFRCQHPLRGVNFRGGRVAHHGAPLGLSLLVLRRRHRLRLPSRQTMHTLECENNTSSSS